jgi:hypothetical protein
LRPQLKELNLKTLTSVDWEADNKTRVSGGLNPHITAVVENRVHSRVFQVYCSPLPFDFLS